MVSLRGRLINVSPYVDAHYKLMYKEYFPYVDGIHAVSQNIAENVGKLQIDCKLLRVVYSGVDLDGIPQKKEYAVKDRFQILSVGRINWMKGYDYALFAIQKLLQKNKNFHYTIVASGDAEELIFMIDDLKLTDYVTIISGLTHVEVLERMKDSDVLLLPSVSEGLANVVLEAMAVGLPVISSNCGGMPEVVKNEETGWLFENRNVDAMFSVLEKVMRKDIKEREACAANGKELIIDRHSINTLSDQMLKFYKEL